MTFYKATRPDGRDFDTGTVDYAVALETGATIEHPGAAMVHDDASTYLSVSTSASDCTGFRWPCRLFLVEPIGDTMTGLAASPSKVACRALRVVEELPAWQALGPNGEAVAALIERAGRVTVDEARRLAAAWNAAGNAAGAAAWNAAWNAARNAARNAAWNAAWNAAGAAAGAAAQDAAGDAAQDAAGDAAWALVMRGLIADNQFRTLYHSWAAVFGWPQ